MLFLFDCAHLQLFVAGLLVPQEARNLNFFVYYKSVRIIVCGESILSWRFPFERRRQYQLPKVVVRVGLIMAKSFHSNSTHLMPQVWKSV
jgi:hypothetical protein